MSKKIRNFLNNLISTLAIFSLTAQPILAQAIVATENGPVVIETANGLPMVMITAPDANGVSHNTYVEFGVGANGAIINNVDENTFLSTTAGYVQGNSNLAGGAASIIINEVTASNPSILNGFIEVAGQRADLIIANPYGITCDGCGFINTDQLTMTTGSTTFENGVFTGLSVNDGAIDIGAAGLDAGDSTRFDIISRQIRVAGAVEGQRIRLIAGRNDVIYATGEVIEKADDGSTKPTLAIDSTVLGGMYADAITIQSTEDGVGVRAPTNMAANAGQMMITADGRLVIGSASAVGNVTVQSSDDIVVEDTVVATQDIDITTAEDLILQANADMVADAAATLSIGGTLTMGAASEMAAGTQMTTTAQAVDIAGTADLISNGALTLNANSVLNDGTIGATGGALLLTSNTVLNTGLLFGDTALTLRSDGTVTNDGGAIVSNANVVIRGDTGAAATLFSNQDGGTVESVSGDITITATTIENTRPTPINDGSVTLSEFDLTGEDCDPDCFDPAAIGTSVTLVGEAAQIIAGTGDITLTADSITNEYSLISAGGNIAVSATTLINMGLNIYRPDPSDPAALELVGAVFGTIEAAGSLVAVVDGYTQNGSVAGDAVISGGTSTGVGDISSTNIGNPNLLVVNVDPDAEFLVESRPEFIDLDQFISSDYFLTAIEYDPELKRFGDAYAEALYIRKQLLALLGLLFLEAGLDEREQIQAMYDNAINAMENLDLTVGVALTPTQIAALTTDIIWLEETVIDGQVVLAPRVYLANPEIRLAALGGAMIVGRDVLINTGEFHNAGPILAENAINIDVDGTFRSESGFIAAEDILISAEDIQIDTGARRVFTIRPNQMSAFAAMFRNSNQLMAGLFQPGDPEYDYRERVARPSTIEAGSTLVLKAAGDIVTQGARISAGSDVALIAGGNILIGAQELSAELGDKEGKNHNRRESLLYLTSTITSGGDISLLSTGNAGGQADIVLQGADIRSAGALGFIAQGGDLVFAAAAEITFTDRAKSKGGFLYKKITRDQVFDLSHQVTTLTGATITGVSNGQIMVEGTRFDVPGMPDGSIKPGELALVSVNAGLTFTAPTDIRAESHYSSRRILGGLITNTKDLRTLVTESLGSVAETAGDMFLNSGADLTLTSVNFQVGGAFSTEVAGATYMLAAIDMDYRFLVEHRDNGIITTDIRQEDLTESITYNAITAAGGVNFDENSPIVFAGVRNPFIDSAHPGAWVAGDSETGQLNIANAYFGGPENQAENAAEGGEDTYWRDDDEWSNEGKLRIIQASLPTSAEGAQFAFMDGLLARDTTIIDPVELADYHFKEVKHSISPAFQMLVSIAVGQWVGGWGIWTGMNSTVAAAGQAFASSVITQSIAGVVSGEFDLGDILENAAFAGLSAGLVAQVDLGKMVGASGDSLIGAKPLTEGAAALLSPAQLLDQIGDAFVSSALDSAVHGTDFGEALSGALRNVALNNALAATQFGIGNLDLGEGTVEHALLHGLAGCAFAEVTGGDCAAGAAAGIAQSIYAGYVDRNGLDKGQAVETAALIGAAAGFFFSSGKAENVSIGNTTAQSGFVNNYLSHDDLANLRSDLLACEEKEGGCSDEDVQALIDKYREISAINDIELANCPTVECTHELLSTVAYVNGDSNALWQEIRQMNQEVAFKLAEVADPSDYVYQSVNRIAMAQSDKEHWSWRYCDGLSAAQCDAEYEIALQKQAEAVALLVDFIPILGDAKGIGECFMSPGLMTCGGAVVGFVPLAGDAIKVTFKNGDELVEVVVRNGDEVEIPNGATSSDLIGDGQSFAGHGTINQNVDGTLPTTIVPEGTSVTVPIGPGKFLDDEAGQLIESGDVLSGMKVQEEYFPGTTTGAQTYLPGAEIPDYVVHPGDDLGLLPGSITVDTPTPLSDLLKPNMGCMNLATCTGIYPHGTTFD